jgi:hypothetical protein
MSSISRLMVYIYEITYKVFMNELKFIQANICIILSRESAKISNCDWYSEKSSELIRKSYEMDRVFDNTTASHSLSAKLVVIGDVFSLVSYIYQMSLIEEYASLKLQAYYALHCTGEVIGSLCMFLHV